MDERDLQRGREALDRKAEEERRKTQDHEQQLIEDDRPQGIVDPRTKNSGHGQKTADKWNQ